MCYNATASIVSFVTGMVSSIILFFYSPAIAIFFIWAVFMQLWDYLIWNNQSKSTANFILTKFAAFFNITQPIVLALAVAFFLKKQLSILSLTLLTVYVIASIIYVLYSWKQIDYTLVTPKSYPSLYWTWNHLPGAFIIFGLYLATVAALLLQHFAYPSNIIIFGFFAVTYMFSLYKYKKISVGRFWCYFGGFVPMFLVALYAFKIIV